MATRGRTVWRCIGGVLLALVLLLAATVSVLSFFAPLGYVKSLLDLVASFGLAPAAVWLTGFLWALILFLSLALLVARRLLRSAPSTGVHVHAFPPPPKSPFAYVPREKRQSPGHAHMPRGSSARPAHGSAAVKRPYSVATAVGGEHLLIYLSRPVLRESLFADLLLSPVNYRAVCRVSLQGRTATVMSAVFRADEQSPMACLDWTRARRKQTLASHLETQHDAAGVCREIAALLYDLAVTAPIIGLIELGNLPQALRTEVSMRLPRILAENAEKSALLTASAYSATPEELTLLAAEALTHA